MQKVGITGHSGFIGQHLVERLARDPDINIKLIDDPLFNEPEKLKAAIRGCECIVHLAGMNRGDEKEIYSTNIRLAANLIAGIEGVGAKPQLIFASSILTEADPANLGALHQAFARSKNEAASIFEAWAKKNGASLQILTIPNVFGDRCKPFYNSVVATLCYQLTHGEKPKIIQDRPVEFIYINELTDAFASIVKNNRPAIEKIRVPGTKTITVSILLAILKEFKDLYLDQKIVPFLSEPFLANLFNVFLSYIDYNDLAYSPKINKDNRGELFEIVKLMQGGQIFFSTTKPGVIRGNHYHTRKIERFCVVKGSACIRMRRVGTKEVKEYRVDSKEPKFIEIPIFHTHHIENTGKDDLYTLFWCNELFDPKDPDTFPEEVR